MKGKRGEKTESNGKQHNDGFHLHETEIHQKKKHVNVKL